MFPIQWCSKKQGSFYHADFPIIFDISSAMYLHMIYTYNFVLLKFGNRILLACDSGWARAKDDRQEK